MVFQQWKIEKIFAEEWCFNNVKNRENDMNREKGMKGMNGEMLLEDGEVNYEWVEVRGAMLLKMKLGSACGEVVLSW